MDFNKIIIKAFLSEQKLTKIKLNDNYQIEVINYNPKNNLTKEFRLLLVKDNTHLIYTLEFVREHEHNFYKSVHNFINSFTTILKQNLNIDYEQKN